jgi:hypothetical protein
MIPMDGQYVTGERDVSHMFCACFAMFHKIHAGHYARFAHVSRMFRDVSRCFARFAEIRMIRGFAMFHDVSHMFRVRFARFAQGITHVSRMFRACFAGVKHGECASHTGRP